MNLNEPKYFKKIFDGFLILTIVFTIIICSGCDTISEPQGIPSIVFDISVITPTTIKLTWVEHNLNVEECIITKENQDSLISTFIFSHNESSFIDNQIIPGDSYYYEIFVNGGEYSYDSKSINTLEPPSNLVVVVSNGEAIKLNWKDNNQIEDIYYIERKEKNEIEFTTIDSLDVNSESYLDFNLEHKKTYIYRVNTRIDSFYTEYTNVDSTGFHFGGLFVPTDYSSIEQALIAASDFEKVILEPGNYDGGIVFPLKNITLCSRFVLENDPSHIVNTVIDGQNQAIIGIKFPSTSYYNPKGKVQGLTIQNCKNGAINCLDHASPTLINLIIKNNMTDSSGAIYFQNCTVYLRNILVYNNSCITTGSAFKLDNSDVRVYNCTIAKNENSSIFCVNNSRFGAYSSIIYGNTGDTIYMNESCWGCSVFYSDIEGGEENIQNLSSENTKWFYSIDSDPLFVNLENNDFHLQLDSPCIDTGENRPVDLDFDGTRNDMGAYGGPDGNW